MSLDGIGNVGDRASEGQDFLQGGLRIRFDSDKEFTEVRRV